MTSRKRIIEITVDQLDDNGSVYRKFSYFPALDEVDQKLDMIRRSYNMDHTRVTNFSTGEVIHEPAESWYPGESDSAYGPLS